MAISTWRGPEPPQLAPTRSAAASSLTRVMRDPGVIALLLVCFCSQLSYAPYYNFFTLFVERHGNPSQLLGLLWSLAVLAEIVMFFYAGRILPRWGAGRCMMLAMDRTMLRWSLSALCDHGSRT